MNGMLVMFIIAGLGNPGKEYRRTRHNIGFDVMDLLSDKYGIDVNTQKHKGLIGKGLIEGEKCVIIKPQTYMNLSGESLLDICNYYKIDTENELIVVYDDIALDIGTIRVRKSGSAGGHNGMKSIIRCLSSENFTRLRVGVGDKPKDYVLTDYVLGNFTENERELMDRACIDAVNAIGLIVTEGVEKAMNTYNRKKQKDEDTDSTSL